MTDHIDDPQEQKEPVEGGTPTEEEQPQTTQKPQEPTEEQNPAGEPQEAPKSEDEPEAKTTEDYEEYDHPALKQTVNILKEAKITVAESNAIFAEAVETGDLSKIDRAALVEKLGSDKADLVLVLAENYYNTQFSAFKAITEEAYNMTGGEEGFNSMRDWANTKAKSDPVFAKDFSDYKQMLDSGNPKAIKAAISGLYEAYKNDPNTTIGANLTEGDRAGGKTTVEPLSLIDYAREVEKARKAGTYEKVHSSLWARRQAGKAKGI